MRDHDTSIKKSDEKSVSELTKTFLQFATLHGYGHVLAETKVFRRVAWLILCILLTIYAVYQIAVVVTDYGNYPKKLNRGVNEEKVVEFPAVTICNLSPLSHSSEMVNDPKWGAFVELDSKDELKCTIHDKRVQHVQSSSISKVSKKSGAKRRKPNRLSESRMDRWLVSGDIGPFPKEPEHDKPMVVDIKRDQAKNRKENETKIDQDDSKKIEIRSGNSGDTPKDCGYGSYTCANGKCVIERYRCDADNDCGDNSDEAECDDHDCPEGYMKCNGYCFPDHYTVSDVLFNCTNTFNPPDKTCSEDGRFKCKEGKCIHERFRCDGKDDCSEKEDERGCLDLNFEGHECADGLFYLNFSRCNSKKRCEYYEDEVDCTSCQHGLVLCTDGICIKRYEHCNSKINCKNGLDEAFCDYSDGKDRACLNDDFNCGDNCINKVFECDGIDDCTDGSDEKNCRAPAPKPPGSTTCPDGYLNCIGDGSCINPRFLCDDQNGCPNEDEKVCDISVTTLEAHDVRMRCSKYYRDILKMKGLSITGTEGNCTFKNSSGLYPETIQTSHFCLFQYVCDFYGCYDVNLKPYIEYPLHSAVCTACGGKKDRCWQNSWVEDHKQGKLNKYFLQLILAGDSRSDFSDVAQDYEASEEEKQKFSFALEDVIISCAFDGSSCDHSSFSNWISRDYGSCYTFNSAFLQKNKTKPKQTSHSGPKHGVRMMLNIPRGLSVLSPENGIRVVVHNPHVLPVPEEEGFNVGPGASSVSISRTQYKRLGKPHGECTSEYEYNDENETPLNEYNTLICRQLCLERRLRENCGCYSGLSPIYDGLGAKPKLRCQTKHISDRVCMEGVKDKFLNGELDCKCYPPCVEMKYEPRVTSTQINENYFALLHSFRKSILSSCSDTIDLYSLEVYLDSLSYEEIAETPAYTFDTLLSNVGGSLGLFIGVSIISVVEVLQFIIDLIIALICPKSSKNSSQVQDIPMRPRVIMDRRESHDFEPENGNVLKRLNLLEYELLSLKKKGLLVSEDVQDNDNASNMSQTFDKLFLKQSP